MRPLKRVMLGVLGAIVLCLFAVPVAQAAPEDPIFIYRPEATPPKPPPPPPLLLEPSVPPSGSFEGPCGLAVDEEANLYVSDYHHGVVDLFSSALKYLDQLTETDPLDGPCALATDAIGDLYVNDYHRNVARYSANPFDAGTVIDGAPLNGAHPTGVAVDPATNDVYVNERTRIAVYDSSGTRLGVIGEGSLSDAYGLAFSEGKIYVPDAATNTVKVYEATLGATDPVATIDGATDPIATIDGAGTPKGHFTSLRDSAIAVDNASGEIYVADNLQPEYAEQPEAVVWVFNSTATYKGRLKYSVADALPVGLAVDNSAEGTQGRVYVSSGNTEGSAVYGYGPGAATNNAVALPGPPVGSGGGAGAGSGPAAVSSAASAPANASSPPAIAPATSLGVPVSKAEKAIHHHKPRRHHRAHPKGAHR